MFRYASDSNVKSIYTEKMKSCSSIENKPRADLGLKESASFVPATYQHFWSAKSVVVALWTECGIW